MWVLSSAPIALKTMYQFNFQAKQKEDEYGYELVGNGMVQVRIVIF